MEPRILSDTEIEEIERRNSKRTPGFWRWSDWDAYFGTLEDESNMTVLDSWPEQLSIESRVASSDDPGVKVIRIERDDERQEDKDFIAACSVDIPNLLESLKAAREALIGAQWIISKLAPHEVLAIQVRGYRPTEEDIATGARYREMIEKALGEEAKRDGNPD